MGVRMSQLRPDVRRAARWSLEVARYYKVPVTVTSTYRSKSLQRRLYNRYKAGESRWPAAKPGQSAHNYGLAFDSTVPARYQNWWNYVRTRAGFVVPRGDEIHAAAPNWRRRARRY
jgi:LAS superfamily LD-carboxypeptidase LdcB